jgi:cysteine-rich repeat protein
MRLASIGIVAASLVLVACSVGVGAGFPATAEGGEATSVGEGSTGSAPTTGISTSDTDDDEGSSGSEGESTAVGGSTGDPESPCGNGVLDEGEVCDDGNADGVDGCSADCTTAHCLVPVSHDTIADAIADAECPVVWVMPGEYAENLDIARAVEIVGVPLGEVVIDGAQSGSVITVDGAAVALSGLVITGGRAGVGGGIRSSGPLVLDATRVEANAAYGANADGGGIHIEGASLTLTNGATVSLNTATATGMGGIARGGGIHAVDADVQVEASVEIGANEAVANSVYGWATAQGGGVHVSGGSLAVNDASIVDNTAAAGVDGGDTSIAGGGGIYADVGAMVSLGPGTLVGGNAATGAHSLESRAEGGGLHLAGGSSVEANEAIVAENTASAASSYYGAWGFGGGIHVRTTAPSQLQIVDTVVDANGLSTDTDSGSAYSYGAGIHVEADEGASVQLTIVRSTISANLAGSSYVSFGGGLSVAAEAAAGAVSLEIVNSTISGNDGGELSLGGGIYVASSAGGSFTSDLANVTITANHAYTGGGILFQTYSDPGPSSLRVKNTIVQGNTGDQHPDCQTSSIDFESGGYNLIGDLGTCTVTGASASDLVGADPQLEPLANNGGPTRTHALPDDSAAVDAGDPDGCTDPSGAALDEDQRGDARPAGGRCDIGAVEIQ